MYLPENQISAVPDPSLAKIEKLTCKNVKPLLNCIIYYICTKNLIHFKNLFLITAAVAIKGEC